jgi:hypothetical protein
MTRKPPADQLTLFSAPNAYPDQEASSEAQEALLEMVNRGEITRETFDWLCGANDPQEMMVQRIAGKNLPPRQYFAIKASIEKAWQDGSKSPKRRKRRERRILEL